MMVGPPLARPYRREVQGIVGGSPVVVSNNLVEVLSLYQYARARVPGEFFSIVIAR